MGLFSKLLGKKATPKVADEKEEKVKKIVLYGRKE